MNTKLSPGVESFFENPDQPRTKPSCGRMNDEEMSINNWYLLKGVTISKDSKNQEKTTDKTK